MKTSGYGEQAAALAPRETSDGVIWKHNVMWPNPQHFGPNFNNKEDVIVKAFLTLNYDDFIRGRGNTNLKRILTFS